MCKPERNFAFRPYHLEARLFCVIEFSIGCNRIVDIHTFGIWLHSQRKRRERTILKLSGKLAEERSKFDIRRMNLSISMCVFIAECQKEFIMPLIICSCLTCPYIRRMIYVRRLIQWTIETCVEMLPRFVHLDFTWLKSTSLRGLKAVEHSMSRRKHLRGFDDHLTYVFITVILSRRSRSTVDREYVHNIVES